MPRLCLLAAALAPGLFGGQALADPGAALPGAYANDPNHSSVLWAIDHQGLSTYMGHFNQARMTLDFDPADVGATRIEVTIDPLDVDTDYRGDRAWDRELATSEDYLNAGAFPSITFVSTAVDQTGSDTASVTGDLTLLGVTRPATLQATYVGSTADHPIAGGPAIGFSAEGEIDRTEFGLDHEALGGIGKTVRIEVEAEFLREGGDDE